MSVVSAVEGTSGSRRQIFCSRRSRPSRPASGVCCSDHLAPWISVDGRLRIWWAHAVSDEKWYRERLVLSLRAWPDLTIEHVLVTHGELVAGGADELAAALERPPFGVGTPAVGNP